MQEESRYKSFFDRLYYKVYNHGKRYGRDIRVTAHFNIDGSNHVVANKAKPGIINELRSKAEFHNPDKIMVVINAGSDEKVFHEDFSTAKQLVTESADMSQVNGKNSQDFSNQMQVIPNGAGLNGFQGFGQVTIDEYINKKLEEERKEGKLRSLESDLAQKIDEITKLNSQVEKLNEEILLANEKQEELEGIIESKKNIRYWAGLTGDILESFGLKKESLREPLAGLIASDGQANQKSITETSNGIDESGIVDETTEYDKRSELITLIGDYLQTVDNQTLANVFMIFSEIEKDKSIATRILQYLNPEKQ